MHLRMEAFSPGKPRPSKYEHMDPIVVPNALPQTFTLLFSFAISLVRLPLVREGSVSTRRLKYIAEPFW